MEEEDWFWRTVVVVDVEEDWLDRIVVVVEDVVEEDSFWYIVVVDWLNIVEVVVFGEIVVVKVEEVV